MTNLMIALQKHRQSHNAITLLLLMSIFGPLSIIRKTYEIQLSGIRLEFNLCLIKMIDYEQFIIVS